MTHPQGAWGGDVLWRKALYGGVLGSVGVILGWLLWFVIQTALAVPKAVFMSPLIGAAVGLAYEFIRDYIAASRDADAGAEPPQVPATGALRRRLGSVVTFASGFLVAATVNVTGDQLSAYLRPFCISVVTFFPAGAAFAWGFSVLDGSEPGHPYERMLRGALVGVLATVASLPLLLMPGIGWLADGTFAWSYAGGLFGWWMLLGIVYSLLWGSEESPRPLAPLGGVGLLVALMLVLSVAGSRLESSNIILRALGTLTRLAMAQPGLPAHAVKDAEALYLNQLKEKAGAGALSAQPAPSAWQTALADALCPASPQIAVALPTQPGPAVAVLQRPEGQRALQVRTVTLARSEAYQVLCNELPQGTSSSLFRSWLVLLMFSLGLGLSKVAESGLRPKRYDGSTLQRRDTHLFYGSVVVLLGALLYIHLP